VNCYICKALEINMLWSKLMF